MSAFGRRIAIVGGGRWGRTLFGVLNPLLAADDRIIWHARHGAAGVQALIARERPGSVFVPDPGEIWHYRPTAAIVATAANAHTVPVLAALERRVPTLVEKPMATTLADADAMIDAARRAGVPLGVNLEFSQASYLQAFARLCPAAEIATIRVLWLDPASEHRHGMPKFADVSTHRCLDIYPHVWSILRLLTGESDIAVNAAEALEESPGALRLGMSAGRAEASAVLSRRAGGRVRLVEVKLRDGRVLSLDFSVEPGVLSVDGTEAVFESGWDSAPRPLAASVGSFLEIVARPERSDRWPLAAQFCRQHVAGALAALDLARASEARLVARHLAAGSPAVPEKIAAILVDNLAPELADMGLSAEARRCSTDRAAALSLAEAGLAKLRSRPVQVEAAVGMALDRSAFLAALRGALQA